MDDHFMNTVRRDPDPNFSRDLRGRLRAKDEPRVMRSFLPVPALAGAVAVAVVASLLLFPSVRASAQAMLDLFRVRKFAAVPFDQTRIDKLRSLKGTTNPMMVFDRHETVVDPGPPRQFATLEEGATAAGLVARRPGFLPNGLVADTVTVEGAQSGLVSVSEAKLRALLEALSLSDVQVPSGLDGKVVEMRKSPILIQRFRSEHQYAALVQSKSPEVSVPVGFDVERLAEIGLRILGLDAGEARRVARATDWRSTMVVPVPLNVRTFRQVTVHGQQGLLVTTVAANATDGQPHRDGTVLLWTENDHVFGLVGDLAPDDLLQMAESVR